MKSSTFTLSCDAWAWLIFYSKNSVGCYWDSNGFGVFTHFRNIEGKID